ncbi:MAG: hypothetical protein V4484_15710 [Pseudomonadota bacterium]
MNNNKNLPVLLSIAVLLAACGGSGGGHQSSVDIPTPAPAPVAAAGLTYVDPAPSGWRLVKDASSTQTRVVLNLVGPDGLLARGAGFNLKRGKCAAFGKFEFGAYAVNTHVFELKGTNARFEAYAGTEADPVLFVSAPLKSGDVLSTGIFQKDRSRSAKPVTAPLVQVALDLNTDAAAGCHAGDVIALSVVKARMVPDDIGAMDFQLTHDAIQKAKMVDIAINAGSLTAN